MGPKRLAALKQTEELLVRGFPVFVEAFSRKPAFSRHAQLRTHLRTVAIRRELGSARAAVHDPQFVAALYETLRAWGIGLRGSRLLDQREFSASLKKHEPEVHALDNRRLGAASIDVDDTAARVWHLVKSLRLVDNKAALVPVTKALHHLLPDLVVPMDRGYTRPFFGFHPPEFQNRQAMCFDYAFRAFHRVAQAVQPQQYVDTGWNSSASKVVDNAVVGVFVVGKSFLDSQRVTGGEHR